MKNGAMKHSNVSKEMGVCVKCGTKYEPTFYKDGEHDCRTQNAMEINAALLEACKVMVEYVNTLDKIPCISAAMKAVGTATKAIKQAEEGV